MKSVLISIQPKWCESICNLIKTAEVRKDKPKLDTPFKCLIYCTVGGDALCPPHANSKKWSLHRQNNGTINGRTMTSKERLKSDYRCVNGKAIGEFVCDDILAIHERGINHNFDYCYESLNEFGNDDIEPYINAVKKSCIPKNELNEYGKNVHCLYGWHISNLKIYDKPRELGEFYSLPTKCRGDCKEENPMQFCSDCKRFKANRKITRPPQSWCYIESEVK